MAQPKVPTVATLPQLDQTEFPAFPTIPTGRFLRVFQTQWNNAEREMVAASVITACIRAGQWQPVPVPDYLDVLEHYAVMGQFPQHIINAAWQMVATEELQILQLAGDIQYVVPTPQLAKIALAQGVMLRYT